MQVTCAPTVFADVEVLIQKKLEVSQHCCLRSMCAAVADSELASFAVVYTVIRHMFECRERFVFKCGGYRLDAISERSQPYVHTVVGLFMLEVLGSKTKNNVGRLLCLKVSPLQPPTLVSGARTLGQDHDPTGRGPYGYECRGEQARCCCG